MTTETTFKVGQVYTDDEGDLVRVTAIVPVDPYPLKGVCLTGQFTGSVGSWTSDGRGLRRKATPQDLSPTPVPDPEAVAPPKPPARSERDELAREVLLALCANSRLSDAANSSGGIVDLALAIADAFIAATGDGE